MKLKEAKAQAKDFGYQYAAVDADGSIYYYLTKPYANLYLGFWVGNDSKVFTHRGFYSGKKPWRETLRKV